MTDIVERLRKYPKRERCNNIFRKTSENAHEAADEIERLRAALRPFADESIFSGPQHEYVTVKRSDCAIALATLEGK